MGGGDDATGVAGTPPAEGLRGGVMRVHDGGVAVGGASGRQGRSCAISPHVGDLGLPAALALSAGRSRRSWPGRRGCPQWPPRETKGGGCRRERGREEGERTRGDPGDETNSLGRQRSFVDIYLRGVFRAERSSSSARDRDAPPLVAEAIIALRARDVPCAGTSSVIWRGTPRIILSPTPEGKHLLARAMPRISLLSSHQPTRSCV